MSAEIGGDMVVSGFWMGAAAVSARVNVAALAAQAGGWEALEAAYESGFAEPMEGLTPKARSRWLASVESRSSGALITRADRRYPRRLAELPDAPPWLLVDGDPDILREPGVAVVGTRKCSTYARCVAQDLGGRIAATGRLVVSGLALGVDAAAHRGALRSGRTLAVLGHGLAHTSPSSHRRLRAEIIEAGGAVVSALADAVPPARHTFPRRNRWVAGISDLMVVVEAPLRSGALITARAALELGREVHAVPGRLGEKGCEGSNRLVSDGASPLWSVDAFVVESCGASVRRRDAWLDALVAGRSLVDVATMKGVSVLELMEELTFLELHGVLTRLPGQRYCLADQRRSDA